MNRILILEPSDDLGKVIAEALQRTGLVCDRAKTAQKAISLADANQPDAVIMELALPAHNGLEFLYEFRSHADWKNIPVIFYSQISAEDCGINRGQLERLRVAAHLYKPKASLQTLQNTLLDTLQTAAV